jgi:transposase
VNEYQRIVVGDVSSLKLAKTLMAKSVLDAGWGMLKTFLQYKGRQAGRCVEIVSERNTTRTCSSCKALTGPSGLDMIVVRTWVCRECGVTHDRDVNAARNILSAARLPPSISGNEPPSSVAEPSQTYCRREAGIIAMMNAAARTPDHCCCWAESATSTFASMRSPPPPWRTPRTGAASR